MVLYDENYKFLGVSGTLLNKLGYEDISDFSSQHKDFADLFEKENGLIYNFDNFSWIDFILYGGANKDTAIITTKNNQKLNIKIDIQEIFLKDDINGVEKLFQVKLLGSDIENFIPQENSIVQSKEINLSSFLDDNDKIEEKEEQKVEVKKEPKILDEPLSINLSFLKEDDVALEEIPKNIEVEKPLNILIEKEEEPKQTIDPIKNSEPISSNNDIVLNFFKDINFKEEERLKPVKNEILEEKPNIKAHKEIEKEEEPTSTINLGFLDKDNEEKTEPKVSDEPKIKLDFLKENKDEISTKPKIEEPKNTPSSINLGFLKQDIEEKTEPKVSDEPNDEPQKKSTIINQIKNDIKEIDSTDEYNLKIDISAQHEEESSINNALKSMLNIGKKTNQNDKKLTFEIKSDKKQIIDEKQIIEEKQVNLEPIIDNISKQNNIPLAFLDIDEEDKKEIIKDFINEASYNSNLIKEFINKEDYSSINYSIIKISSSAEILSLNQINKILSSLKQAVSDTNISQAYIEIENLDNALNELKKYK